MKNKKISTDGFTIIELLIATAVFSVILLICSFAMIQIGRVYYKGVTSTNTQNVSRSVIDEISQGIQFSGGTIVPTHGSSPIDWFCINGQRYSFVIDKQLTDNGIVGLQSNHVLYQDTSYACADPGPVSSWPSGGRELLAPGMRIGQLSVTTSDSIIYSINLQIATGESDLFAQDTSQQPSVPKLPLVCNGGNGSQFCSTSQLNTVVQKRTL